MLTNLLGWTVGPGTYNAVMGVRIACFVLLGVCALVLAISVLVQAQADGQGSSALTGSSETYYSQHKGSTKENVLKKITLSCAIIMFVVTIVLTILLQIQGA